MIDFTQETYQNILQTMLGRIPDTYPDGGGAVAG